MEKQKERPVSGGIVSRGQIDRYLEFSKKKVFEEIIDVFQKNEENCKYTNSRSSMNPKNEKREKNYTKA